MDILYSPPVSEFARQIHAQFETLLGGTDKPGILAVSGGADSVSLWLAMSEIPWNAPITIAHFNHQLRGDASDADAEFVRELGTASRPVVIGTADIQAIATERGHNLESTARQVRYDFLQQTARDCGAIWVATAHTLDDQAETVLHRFIRGSGLRGLRGIAPLRPLQDPIQLVRPMLAITRHEVLSYLQAKQQTWREDHTNTMTAYTRNRLRHELLPVLAGYNPQIRHALSRLASQAQEAYTEIAATAQRHLTDVELPRHADMVILNRQQMNQLSDHQQREVLRLIWHREHWPTGEMSHDHWQRAVSVIRGNQRACDLPAFIRIRGTKLVIQLMPTKPRSPSVTHADEADS